MEAFMSDDTCQRNAVELTTELTIAWLGNQNTRTSADDVPTFLSQMHTSIQSIVSGLQALETVAEKSKQYVGAVTARKSLASPDHIISMINGKSYKTLRRHLATNGMTPAEYRERYNLKADYPMVAATYSESRRAMAKKIGLGRKPGQSNAATAEAAKPASRKRKADDVAE
jgi:predicted transcriptional regulator